MQGPTPTELFFERLTAWVGSTPSLLLHTVAFIAAFAFAVLGWAAWDTVLLVVTTIVSLEAIYLAIFIQMTVNRQARELHAVSEDVEDIQEDVAEISEDVAEISEDVEDIQEGVEEINEDWDLETGEARPHTNAIGVGARAPESATIDQLKEDVKRILVRLDSLHPKS